MNCKNCNTELHEHDDYCKKCGARVIRNRLTFKNIFEHISETFFNYDNKLLRTFTDLIAKPEAVIGSYISGVRKRYVNPISYLGIALTLSGVVFFVMKKINLEVDVDVFNQGMDETAKSNIANASSEYASFFFLSYIPMLVIASWFMLRQKEYNFAERTVAFTYTMAEFSLVTFLPSILVMIIMPNAYMNYSFITLLVLAIYLTWLLYKISGIRGIEFFAHLLIFFFCFAFLFFAFSIGLVILGLLTGELNLQDFMPPPK
ncbi:MAG: DUF3667 domain-containing protein [Winogradskyella sp.]|uniref:DUF3667 domain-containing protein n=1 Tax=Winogradskyella sp. TaxID=1883156 RepID=UPI000F3AF406|nr:DUF3667 domain-containing protein [Winogradskyella sp.]RNC86690.1 MAG: DUF3667 domain-containing protein [Winogradskyella sp.]